MLPNMNCKDLLSCCFKFQWKKKVLISSQPNQDEILKTFWCLDIWWVRLRIFLHKAPPPPPQIQCTNCRWLCCDLWIDTRNVCWLLGADNESITKTESLLFKCSDIFKWIKPRHHLNRILRYSNHTICLNQHSLISFLSNLWFILTSWGLEMSVG